MFHQYRRRNRVTATIAGLAALMLASPAFAAEVPKSPWLAVVYRYADAMVKNGRDTFGPQKSGLFLGALDRTTLRPLTTRPAAPAGVRETDRVGAPGGPLVGANPQLDENLLRLLYTLRGLSGEKRYDESADNEMKWFLEHTASPSTGLLPWGEHASWDVMADEPSFGFGQGVHEFSRPWLLWDKCFALAPEASKRFALALWEHQIADHKTGAFDRHAPYSEHGPTDGNDFPRHAGFYIRTWAEAYAQTKDEVFLKAIETLLGRFERNRYPTTSLISLSQKYPQAALASSLSLAIDCNGAAGRVPEALATRLRAFTAREDEVFCSAPHDLKNSGGFASSLDRDTGKPIGRATPLWNAAYGTTTTAAMGMMCVSRYENMGRVRYRDLVAAAADMYLASLPGDDVDAWPMTFGHAISLELAAWRFTAREAYFKRAQELANIAVERFWGDNALPRASLKTQHYESITGPDTLALALTEVHLATLHMTAVRVPSNTVDR